MKAFAVTENFESTGAIIFAKHAVVARRLGANEYADGEFSSVRCRRAPWADHCAETGIVPAALAVEHGWHFECMGCGQRIDEDLREHRLDAAYDRPFREKLTIARRWRKWAPSKVVGSQHSAVFCDQQCKDELEAHKAERERRQDRAIAVFRAKVLKRFPAAEFVESEWDRPHAYAVKRNGRWKIEQVIIPFNFPGMKYGPAQYRWDAHTRLRGQREKPRFTCCGGDKEAFEAWASGESLAA